MLEAAELPFEHLWIMGLDDTNWPASPKPNPLIPQRLQKKLHMPHATIEREFIYCDRLITQLKNSAEHIIFSYPTQEEDIPLRPSSFLDTIESLSLNELVLSDFILPAQSIFKTRELELFTDEIAPPIQENEVIRGGTSIFKQQALCPFKAFAELRLHARAIDIPILGLRPTDKGSIVHKALELIWKHIKDFATLISLSHHELKEIITTYAKEAIQSIINEDTSNKRYLTLELHRLEKISLDWIKLECNRPAFKIAHQEHEMNTMIGQIPVTVRVDRIDELEDGSQLIIDYKTGKNEIKKWFGERPEEPQLPLYCLLGGEKVSGIAFGQIHPDNMNLLGVRKKNISINSIKATDIPWELQLQEWKTALDKLGNDFLNGIAHVDPKDTNQVCSTCKLHTFCRVHEK